MKDVKKVVAQLLKNGAKEIDNVVVKTASVVSTDSYDTVRLTLNQEVPGMVRETVDGEDVYKRGMTNVVWVSIYSLNAILANDPNTATARKIIIDLDDNGIIGDGNMIEDFLTWATIDIIQEPVYTGNDSNGNPLVYINPFSDNAIPREIEHDSYYTHIIAVEPGDDGWDILDSIKDARKEVIAERTKARFAARLGKRGEQKTNVRRTRVNVVEETSDDEVIEEVEETSDNQQ